VPTGEISNNMARAQFIVPLQHNYNQKVIICYKIICNVPYTQPVENIFGFLGNNHNIIERKL
jgi:hypothetical protein